MKILRMIVLAVLATGFTACENENEVIPTELTTNGSPESGGLRLRLSNVESLGNSADYEAWYKYQDEWISAGKFDVNQGVITGSGFTVNSDQLEQSSAVMVTIEPKPDPSPAPSNTRILAGGFLFNAAYLNTETAGALGRTFTSANGEYHLQSPTSGERFDELSGIWFSKDDAGKLPGLNLPELPDGWKYEGWVVSDGKPISIGKFRFTDGSDENAQFGGTGAGLAVPGEDFLENPPAGFQFPLALNGQKVMITIEPHPDNSTLPFTSMGVLSADIPVDAETRIPYKMQNISGKLPTGKAERVVY